MHHCFKCYNIIMSFDKCIIIPRAFCKSPSTSKTTEVSGLKSNRINDNCFRFDVMYYNNILISYYYSIFCNYRYRCRKIITTNNNNNIIMYIGISALYHVTQLVHRDQEEWSLFQFFFVDNVVFFSKPLQGYFVSFLFFN